MDGKLITLEGVSGIGKTYYFNELERIINNNNIIFNKEITNEKHSGINKKIFDLLSSTDSPFFDCGNPKLETLLIMAKQANDEESFVIPALKEGKSVISDRGYDTICVLQGIFFSFKYGNDPMYYANELYRLMPLFNIIPNKTILLTGNTEDAILRAEARNGIKYSEEEKQFLRMEAQLFLDFSKIHQDRYELINVDEGYDQTIKQLKRIIKKEGI